jgi:uncharacterized membrane protein YebE (DUF533 family)
MSAMNLLEQLLQSGSKAMGGSEMSKYGTGAIAGGALAMLLGPKRGMSRKALQVGGVAALGAMAWKAYRDHQSQQGAGSASAGAAASAGSPPAAAVKALPSGLQPAAQPAPLAALPAPTQEAHGQAMLRALIAAAKCDGHLDDRERGLLEAELHRLEADPAMRAWVDAELHKPVDPGDVAAGVTDPALAAEVYLASLLVVDEARAVERAYLDALARALRLDPWLKAELEARAAAAA